MNVLESASARPYLIRALHEWCSDSGLTPYLAIQVDDGVQVPREYVRNGEIVLNVSYDATSQLKIDNDYVSFKARFGGVPRDVICPIDRVLAIYARENGVGMGFPPVEQDVNSTGMPEDAGVPTATESSTDGNPPPAESKRPALKLVK